MPADLRLAARTLFKTPTFSAVAVLTLALCIGANTAVFSVADAILFRPLPYPHPERLFSVITEAHGHGLVDTQIAEDGRTWEAVRDGARDFDAAVFSDGSGGVNLVVDNAPRYVKQQRVSAGFFHVLGIAPRIGREFSPIEDRVGGPAVAILSDSLWRSTFHSDPSVIGSKVLLRGEPFTVIGVMPPGFRTDAPTDVWTPLRPSTTGEGGGTNYRIAIRLHPGISETGANEQLRAIGAALFRDRHLPAGVSIQLRLMPLEQNLTYEIRKPVLMLWYAVLAVLLIGCVNIAGLLLARSGSRAREMGTRLALGAGKLDIVRQLLAESLLLAAFGTATGLVLGRFALLGLKHLDIASLGIDPTTISLDSRVLIASAILGILTSVVFGLYPALQTTRVDIRSTLVQGAAHGASASSGGWARRGFTVAEVALSTVLLIGAGLLLRTFFYLLGLDPGFDSRNVMTASLSLHDARYQTADAVNHLYDESLRRIREIPGVEAAGVGLSLPYTRALNTGFSILDGPHPGPRPITNFTYVTTGYFEALRMKLLRGRLFRDSDNAHAPRVAIVNEAFVKRYLNDGGGDALGRHLDSGEIIGIIGSVQELATGWGGDFGPLRPMPEIYVPAEQMKSDSLPMIHTWFSPVWVVRSHDSPKTITAALRHAVAQVDPMLPFAEFKSMDEVRSDALGFQRLTSTLLGALAALALLLAAVGIYGLIASSVVERTRELGIRMALGASIGDAIRAVALPGITLAAIGITLGCAGGLGAARLMHSLIFGVAPADPVTFLVVAVSLLVIAALASFIPSLRAARIDPAETLRVQ
jgi:predicted permease